MSECEVQNSPSASDAEVSMSGAAGADSAAEVESGPDAAAADAEAAKRQAAEEQEEALRRNRLLRLMQSIEGQADFASMKDAVQGIQKVARSERSHARALTGLIYDDAAMVSKLLRLINAAFYRTAGGGEITCMQRAVALMGFQNVGMLASSLMLFDRLPKGADGDRLRLEFARSQYAALLAHDLCTSGKHIDSIYITALFQRLGDLLAGLHFQEDAQVIEDLLDADELVLGSAARHEAREKLARKRWGMGIEDIGIKVAGMWGWPDSLLMGMQSLRPSDPERVLSDNEYLRALCTGSNCLALELMNAPEEGDAEERVEARKQLVLKFAAEWALPLGLDPEALPEMVERARTVWLDLVKALGITLTPGGPAAKTAQAAPKLDPNSAAYRKALAEDLADAVDQLSRMNKRGAPLAEVMDTSMRLMMKALDMQRVIVCLLDPSTGNLTGRVGVGDKAVVLAPHFQIPLQPPSELFGLLCAKNADTLIVDSSDPVINQRLPEWFTKRVRGAAFLVLPLAFEGKVLGMMYGDQSEVGRMVVNDRALTLLKNLRNQLLVALRTPPKA
ncbi:HDOD domain-containing protein [Paucibacter sp. AS339]|uniref:HDOD domain-containing protein n=1 Tax=Paucibacter hankyongi TaxID=3133434 RepID=UPI0030AB5CEF